MGRFSNASPLENLFSEVFGTNAHESGIENILDKQLEVRYDHDTFREVVY